MSTMIAFSISAVLLVTALAHVYWALGGLWPGRNETELAQTVVGANGIKAMPPRWMTGPVAVAIFVSALWPLIWIGTLPLPVPPILLLVGMVTISGILLLRGVAGFIPAVRRANSEMPFARLDRLYFTPLIVMLGIGYLYLLLEGRPE